MLRDVFVDDNLRTQGTTRYDVYAMDLWGRWSPPASDTVEVRDLVPPPPPSRVEGQLEGDPKPDGRFDALNVSFTWPQTSQNEAPDTRAFEVFIRAGIHEAGPLEQATDVKVVVTWPQIAVDAASGAAASVTMVTLEDGTPEVHVRVPDVTAARTVHRWETSVVTRAVDEVGNRSRPSRVALARYVEEVTPEVPRGQEEVQFTTWPDASGRGYYRVSWPPQQPGARVQVFRASQARLLQLADQDVDAFQSRSQNEQASLLKTLAAEQQHAFVPDRSEPYDHTVRTHLVAISAKDRSLTVLMVRPIGPTGNGAPWPNSPSAFTVVAGRGQGTKPSIALRCERENGGVRLTANTDGTRIFLFRATDPEVTSDPRRMRPLSPRTVQGGSATVLDTEVLPGQWYAYRAIAATNTGIRSKATLATWIKT